MYKVGTGEPKRDTRVGMMTDPHAAGVLLSKFVKALVRPPPRSGSMYEMVRAFEAEHGEELNGFFYAYFAHLPPRSVKLQRFVHAILLNGCPEGIFPQLEGTDAKRALVQAVPDFLEQLKEALATKEPERLSLAVWTRFSRAYAAVVRQFKALMQDERRMSRSSTPDMHHAA
jgi:hypothetical protein